MSEFSNIELAGVEVAHEEGPHSAVVRGVDWIVRPGERWAVCGGPGGGKTSLLCTGAGLTAPVAGTLRAFGRDYWGADESDRLALGRRIGMVFDGGGRLFAHMSIFENLALPLQYHRECDREEAREQALQLLALVDLEAWADAAPSRLTTALQRRAALARTLTEPVEVLFLDAPLVGLGPEERRWWLLLLRDLSEQGDEAGGPMSIVTSGYEFSSWLGWADRFAVLGDGSFRTLDEAEARAVAGAEAGPAASVGA
jgi:ABC-type transporter Mla maintaining outer membrane lipid asymmetry ATPase subunit MlaF